MATHVLVVANVTAASTDLIAAIREPHVHEFGREGAKPMKGFVVVEPEGVEDDEALARWVDVGAARAASMPPK